MVLSVFHFTPCVAQLRLTGAPPFFRVHISSRPLPHFSRCTPPPPSMRHFTPEQKHEILLEYSPNSATHSFAQLAARHNVGGGGRTVQRWHSEWDGTVASLQRKEGSGRPRALSRAEVQQYVRGPILRANRAHRAIHYPQLIPAIQGKPPTPPSLRTVQRYGKEDLGAKQRRGKKRTADESECTHTGERDRYRVCRVLLLIEIASLSVSFSVSAEMCEDIAKVRRTIQREGKCHILFLDETHKREGDVDSHSLFLPGEPPYIETSSTSNYAARYDAIATCSGEKVLPMKIYPPKERGKGIDTAMLIDFMRNELAQAAGALDQYPVILVLDKAPIHNEAEIKQTFIEWGCQELTTVIKMPPAAAKRLSPLDNSLFNVWRQRVLAGGPLTKANIIGRMNAAWESFTKEEIQAQYRNCGLFRGQDVYFDCPAPTLHQHGR
jgi:hypothetical protein